jgi:hypothetical protein
VFNEFSYDHSVAWLETALEIRAAHGMWTEDVRTDITTQWYLARLTAEQVALPAHDRDALLRKVAAALVGHAVKFHKREYRSFGVKFEAPGGGGWQIKGGGMKIEPYKGEEP